MDEMSKGFKIFSDCSEEIDTSESYRGDLYEVDNDIIIPCINVGVSECLLNASKQLNYIDYCYLVFKDVTSVEVNASPKLLSGIFDKAKKLLYIGAVNITSDHRQGELEIECDNMYLVLKSDSKLSDQMWIPIQTPYLTPNLSEKEVQKFFTEPLGFVYDNVIKQLV